MQQDGKRENDESRPYRARRRGRGRSPSQRGGTVNENEVCARARAEIATTAEAGARECNVMCASPARVGGSNSGAR